MSFNFSVKARIVVTVAVAGVALLLVGLLGFRTATSVNETMKSNHEVYFLGVKALSELNIHTRQVSEQMLVAVLTRTPEASRAALDHIATDRKKVDELWQWYVESTVTE